MNGTFFRILQWTWGLPQNLLGALLYLRYRRSCRHLSYRGAAVTLWPDSRSLSLGMFLFVSVHCRTSAGQERLLRHEYGHSMQSLILGPLYLPVIGIPSLLWCRLPGCERYRKRTGKSYYGFFPERWADRLGKSKY